MADIPQWWMNTHGHDLLYLSGELNRLTHESPTQLTATATRLTPAD
jgi:hypothetical protein